MLFFFSMTFAGCLPDGGPCMDYCDYICECHDGEDAYNCDDCRTVYAEADATLSDECQTELTDLHAADDAAGTGCVDGLDSGA